MIVFRRMLFIERIKRINPSYRKKKDDELKNVIRDLVKNPEIPCYITDGLPPVSDLVSAGFGMSNVSSDDDVPYWLCCGSTVYPHGAESCFEAQCGHPERVRFGTAEEHSEWQRRRNPII